MTNEQKTVIYGVFAAAGGYFIYQRERGPRRASSRLTTYSSPGAAGSVTPFDPQNPVTLQPGESVYDPNSQALQNTPTAIEAGQPLPLQSQTPSAPAYVINVNYGRKHRNRPPLTAPGAVRAPFGPKKPRPRKGYRIRGLGNGFWEYVPVQKRKKAAKK